MTDDHARTIDLNDAWDAVVRGDEPGDQSAVPDADRRLMQSLHQAAAMHYPAPDAAAAWQRVMAHHAHPDIRASEPIDRLRSDIPRAAALAFERHPIPPLSDIAAPLRWRTKWRSITSVVALAAVIALGLLGSFRGLVPWSPFQAQTGDTLTTFQAVSSDADQEVLALDPEVLAARLGSGWNLRSAWAGVADVEAPGFTGFLGSTRLVLEGPDDALITVEVLPVAADPSSPAKAWAWTSSDIGSTEQSRLVASGSREPAGVSGCRQAIHIEGNRKADQTSVGGITLCAVGSSEIVLVITSSEILGNEGWAASDRVATFVATELADAPIVPTHRFEGSVTTESGLYRYPLIDALLVRPLTPGTLLRWTGDVAPSPDADRKTPWLKMRTADGAEGWVPGDVLVPTVEGRVPGSFLISTPEAE